MANKTETRPRQDADAVDRSAALRNVMEVLAAKGFAKASIADLKSAVGPGYGALHKAFGTRDGILRAAIRFCAGTGQDTVAAFSRSTPSSSLQRTPTSRTS
jgi:AcrR family transcriptional regulator